MNTLYLEFDKTGVSINNLVVLETQQTPSTPTRLLVPLYGAFYSQSLVVYSVNTLTDANTLLTRGVDYLPIEMLAQVTAQVGKEVCTAILLTDSAQNTKFRITYQALGGAAHINRDVLFDLFEQVTSTNAPVSYYDIQNRPSGFIPGDHLHDSIDVYGLEYVRDAILKLDAAIAIGSSDVNQKLVDVIEDKINEVRDFGSGDLHSNIDASMSVVSSVEEVLINTNLQRIELEDALVSLNENTSNLKDQLLDYKARYYNSPLANVANLLCKKNHDESGLEIDVPVVIGADDLVLYLKADNYNASTGVWLDSIDNTSGYTSAVGSRPIKVSSTVAPALQAVRMTAGKFLSKTIGSPVTISPNTTVFVVSAASSTNTNLKLQLFSDAVYKADIDVLNYTGLRVTNISTGDVPYTGVISRKLPNAPTTIVSTISNRLSDRSTISSSPRKMPFAENGVVQTNLNPSSISINAQVIGSTQTDQDADLFMVIVINRLLSRAEIHAILTYIRINYSSAVNCVENGDFKNWDVGYSSDFDSVIDFTSRGFTGVTSRPIALWDTTNTYTQPGAALASDIRIDNNPYLLVLVSDDSKAFWRQEMVLDKNCRHELKFSLVYGLTSLPQIRLKINGTLVGSPVTLDPSKSLLTDHVIAFTPSVDVNTIELFNFNESTGGNCFGIGGISIQRKIYEN